MLKPKMIKEISDLTGQTRATVADILSAHNDVIALELRVSGAAKLHGLGE
jgi:nucleoid DNA-binding protein